MYSIMLYLLQKELGVILKNSSFQGKIVCLLLKIHSMTLKQREHLALLYSSLISFIVSKDT